MKYLNKINNRRSFLTTGSITGATSILSLAAVHSFLSKEKTKPGKKVKALTADGKLVEVDEFVFSQIALTEQRATNKDLQEWMKTAKS